mgnify:CR=1 FL=1
MSNKPTIAKDGYKTLAECSDPRNGVVAIFFGSNEPGDTAGFWVEAQRVEFYSDYVSKAEAQELYNFYSHNSQRQ